MNNIFDAAFAAFLAIAAVQDARRREVEHWTIIGMAVIALAHMFYTQDYEVLWSLIPTGIMVRFWYRRPGDCGAADIKVIGALLMYTGLRFVPLVALIVACIFAMAHMLFFKLKGTPFCLWVGIAGCGLMAVRIFA